MTSKLCDSCLLISLIVFNIVKLLLGYIDFFYRASKFRVLLVTLFPLVKVGVLVACLLQFSIPEKHHFSSQFLLAEIVIAVLAFIATFFQKNRDNAYLVFLVLVTSEILLSANSINSFGVWSEYFHVGKSFIGNIELFYDKIIVHLEEIGLLNK